MNELIFASGDITHVGVPHSPQAKLHNMMHMPITAVLKNDHLPQLGKIVKVTHYNSQ